MPKEDVMREEQEQAQTVAGGAEEAVGRRECPRRAPGWGPLPRGTEMERSPQT